MFTLRSALAILVVAGCGSRDPTPTPASIQPEATSDGSATQSPGSPPPPSGPDGGGETAAPPGESAGALAPIPFNPHRSRTWKRRLQTCLTAETPEIQLTIHVAADGKATSEIANEVSDALEKCVASMVGTIVFPAARTDMTMTITK